MHGGEGCRRVLMTADAVGGVWDYALQLAEGLGTCGVEVTLATMGPLPRDDQRALPGRSPVFASLRVITGSNGPSTRGTTSHEQRA